MGVYRRRLPWEFTLRVYHKRLLWEFIVKGYRGLYKGFLKKLFMNFLGKMVDINTWQSRIGTFSQKSKKVFYVLKSQGKKVIVSSCYFSCFVVSVNMEFNLLFI